jgi:hypothetical protein
MQRLLRVVRCRNSRISGHFLSLERVVFELDVLVCFGLIFVGNSEFVVLVFQFCHSFLAGFVGLVPVN